MKHFLSLAITLAAGATAIGQDVESTYPRTLAITGDTFYVAFSDDTSRLPLVISQGDTVDMGADGQTGLTATVYGHQDSFTIAYTNLPFAQVVYIPVRSKARQVVYRLHFNPPNCDFSPAYMAAHRDTCTFEIPEVYELANIVWILSPSGQRAADLPRTGEYYTRVREWFGPYLNHPVFARLDFADSLYFKKYYDFRENSAIYSFRDDRLVSAGPYYSVWGDGKKYTNLFSSLLPLLEDFAQVSHFREFFRQNAAFYTAQVQRQKALMPVRSMWTWLEREFPDARYQSYKIIFSPLIGGAHSTQQYWQYDKGDWFGENVMFVCGPAIYDNEELTETQRRGLLSGIVFTEIDHNYVNPRSYRFHAAIDSAFSERRRWATAGDAGFYDSPMAVFNEYMTHAVFCLWTRAYFDAATAEFVVARREALMVEKRGFRRFREFNRMLFALRESKPEAMVSDLYPAIVAWCAQEK